MAPSSDQWRSLLQVLHEETPLSDFRLYVKPKRGCADGIAQELLDDPNGRQKFLLAGARGGGKSTELRAVAALLGKQMTLVTVDLDASDIAAPSVSAHDLLYVTGVALLGQVPRAAAQPLFVELKKSYAGAEAEKLGDLDTALKGIASGRSHQNLDHFDRIA